MWPPGSRLNVLRVKYVFRGRCATTCTAGSTLYSTNLVRFHSKTFPARWRPFYCGLSRPAPLNRSLQTYQGRRYAIACRGMGYAWHSLLPGRDHAYLRPGKMEGGADGPFPAVPSGNRADVAQRDGFFGKLTCPSPRLPIIVASRRLNSLEVMAARWRGVSP